MRWNDTFFQLQWSQEIINYDEKIIVAEKIASFVNNNDVIGFGSGSTSFLAAQVIGKRVREERLNIIAIPTSNEIRIACVSLGIPVSTINDLKPDWCFDGADEVDMNNWLIKGRGGAMFIEKLIMSNSAVSYIIVDNSKFVSRLGENFPVPVECVPSAYISVMDKLYGLSAKNVSLRLSGKAKDGPVITENGNYILDAVFDNISSTLESEIKSIIGVIESGLFIGYDVKIIKASD
jgi:ribose 5-phosphate isomerase A